jgi:hypothetical protein
LTISRVLDHAEGGVTALYVRPWHLGNLKTQGTT